MRDQAYVGVVSAALVFLVSCAVDQTPEDAWDIEETAEPSAEVEDTSPGPAALPDIPFPVDENVVIHRHSRQDPTFGSTIFRDENGNRLYHTHAIELEVPGGMLRPHKTTGRIYAIVPGSVLQTPEDHLFEFLSDEYLSPDMQGSGPNIAAWKIQTDAWGTISVKDTADIFGLNHSGIYIRSHPKPERQTEARSASPPTTYTEFNQPGGEGPPIEIQVWRTDEPSLKTYRLERLPHRDPINFDHHRGYYRVPD